KVEGGVDRARLHPLAELRTKHRRAGPARNTDPVAIAYTAILGIDWVDLQSVFRMPDVVVGTARLRSHVVLSQDATCGEQQREAAGDLFFAGHITGNKETPLAAHEAAYVHGFQPGFRSVLVARPLNASQAINFFERHAAEGGR